MTTATEQKILPKAYAAAKKHGTTATFTLYPSETQDTDESEVDLGAPVVHSVVIIPPDELSEEFDSAGQLILARGLKFQLMTGALTSEPIAFVPAAGQRCTLGGQDYTVRSVNAARSGDLVAYYDVEARA